MSCWGYWIGAISDAVKHQSPGSDSIDVVADNLWAFVNDPLYVAWQELVSSSRTDPELRAIIEPAANRYEEARRLMDKTVYPEFREASHDKFARNQDTLRFLLEGMASSILNYDQEARV